MTRIVPLFVAIAAAAAPLAAQSFEGKIWFVSTKEDGRADTIVQFSKPGYLRVESGGATGRMGAAIINTKTRTLTLLDTERKMYMTRQMPTIDPAADSSMADFTVTETARTETVAGVTCHVYEGSRTKNGKVEKGEACLAKGVGLQIGNALGPMMASAAPRGSFYAAIQRMRAQDLHVMKFVTYKDGKVEGTMTAIKVERGSVPQSEFEPPSDYQGMQLPANIPMTPPR